MYWGSGLSEHNGTRYDLLCATHNDCNYNSNADLHFGYPHVSFVFFKQVQIHGDGPPGH